MQVISKIVCFTVIFMCLVTNSSGVIDPEKEYERVARYMTEAFDYIKEKCPVTDDYDNILTCCKWRRVIEGLNVLINWCYFRLSGSTNVY